MHINVIGAINTDITARCTDAARMYDSNISTVSFSHGGVGRNIVHNCALLGLDCSFISAAGTDAFADGMMNELRSLGTDISRVIRDPELSTGTYIAFIDGNGEMIIAANDMRINEKITPRYLESCRLEGGLNAFDANLGEDAIEYIVSLKAPCFAEPVSGPKCVKLKPFLGSIDVLKPNVYEAEALTGIDTSDEAGIIRAGMKLNEAGTGKVYITAGEKGAYLFENGKMLHAVPPRTKVVNATGAGDAFSAGILYSLAKDLPAESSLKIACAMSSAALTAGSAVNTDISEKSIEDYIKEKTERNEWIIL